MSKPAPSRSGGLRRSIVRVLSNVRERRLRVPSPLFLLSRRAKKATTDDHKRILREVRENGITRLPGLIDADTVNALQAGVDRMVDFADQQDADVQQGEEFDVLIRQFVRQRMDEVHHKTTERETLFGDGVEQMLGFAHRFCSRA